MSLSDALNDKLKLPGVGEGAVEVESSGVQAEVELEGLGPLGARVRRVRVRVGQPRGVQEQAQGVCEQLRGLEERLVPVEVDEGLGGGILRSDPADMRGRDYYEVAVTPDEATLERYRAQREGGRESQPFTVTREQLGRIVDDLGEGLGVEPSGPETDDPAA